MHLSDALSHLSSHNKAIGKIIKDLDVSIHAIEELTGFNSLSVDKLHHHMAMDKDLQLLISHISDGFSESSSKCPACMHTFFRFRDKLSMCNGLVLIGNNRLVVPSCLR